VQDMAQEKASLDDLIALRWGRLQCALLFGRGPAQDLFFAERLFVICAVRHPSDQGATPPFARLVHEVAQIGFARLQLRQPVDELLAMIGGIVTGIDQISIDAGRACAGYSGQTPCQKYAPRTAYHDNIQNRYDLWAVPLPERSLGRSPLRRK
jgi:hypothetical protein